MTAAANGSALAVVAPSALVQADYFTPDQVDLIKRTIAKGCTDDELKLFLHQCQRTGLDPFSRQIYAIRRNEWDAEVGAKVPKMVIQTAIDGYRVIADRTGRYAPGPEPTFEYDDKRNLIAATAHVRKRTPDGTWHDVAATAHFDEYAGYTAAGKLTRMWAEKPRIMLAKCAEALALRKAFPAELAGVYTGEEMEQADNPPDRTAHPAPLPPKEHAPRPLPAPSVGRGGEPAVDSTPGAAPSASDRATPSQVKALHVALSALRLGVADCDRLGLRGRERETALRIAYLQWISAMVGRPVASSKGLSSTEISQLIDAAKAGEMPEDDLPDPPPADDSGPLPEEPAQ